MKQVIKEITALQERYTNKLFELREAEFNATDCRAASQEAERRLTKRLGELKLITLDSLLGLYRPDPILPSGAWVITNFRIDRTKVRCCDIILPDFISIFIAEYDDDTQVWTGAICYPVNQEISDRDRALLDNPIFNWDTK